MARFLHSLDPLTLSATFFGTMVSVFFLAVAIRGRLERLGRVKSDVGNLGAIEGALLGLFALILGFSFSMAAGRFDARRASIVHEANTISTALMRADLFEPPIRESLRGEFQRYLELRIAYFEAGADWSAIDSAFSAADEPISKMWQTVGELQRNGKSTEAARLMLPALNEMADAKTSRDAALRATVPESILWVLLVLGVLSSFLIGIGQLATLLSRSIGVVFTMMVAVSVYLIIDLDQPRKGSISLNRSHQKILEIQRALD